MTPAAKLGEQLRRLGSLVGVRSVRHEDERRERFKYPSVASRAEQVEHEADTVEKSL